MFGNDTADRFLSILTFSDGMESEAEKSIKEANFKITKIFHFNNGAIFKNFLGNSDDKNIKFVFDINNKGYKSFTDYIKSQPKTSISMKLT